MKKLVFIATALLATQVALAKGVEATDAYARAQVAGVQQSGAFVTLKNTDAKANALVGASVGKDVAERTEIHTHVNDNGVMRMRKVKRIVLPAGKTVELKPGSYHVMFFGLKTTFEAGKTFPMTLKFKDGSKKTVTVTVKELQAHKHHHHHHGDGHQH